MNILINLHLTEYQKLEIFTLVNADTSYLIYLHISISFL